MTQPRHESGWLFVRDVARLKGVTEQAVRKAISDGRIRGIKVTVGVRTAVPRDEVERYLQMKRGPKRIIILERE